MVAGHPTWIRHSTQVGHSTLARHPIMAGHDAYTKWQDIQKIGVPTTTDLEILKRNLHARGLADLAGRKKKKNIVAGSTTLRCSTAEALMLKERTVVGLGCIVWRCNKRGKWKLALWYL
jgi:hypothetical protein